MPYKDKNKEKERQIRYRTNNRSKERARSKIYRNNNKGKVAVGKKRWKDNNQDRVNETARRYRAGKKHIIEDFSNEEWLNKLRDTFGLCPRCNKYVGIAHLELDHIYPVSVAYKDYKRNGAKRIYTIHDIQPLCSKCNKKKGVRI